MNCQLNGILLTNKEIFKQNVHNFHNSTAWTCHNGAKTNDSYFPSGFISLSFPMLMKIDIQ